MKPHVTLIGMEYRRGLAVPGRATEGSLVLKRGSGFERAARLVPLPLPHPLSRTPCVPIGLWISASDGSGRWYTPCSAPAELRPLVDVLCARAMAQPDYPSRKCPERFSTWHAATAVWGS
jgi:hypothetical protein